MIRQCFQQPEFTRAVFSIDSGSKAAVLSEASLDEDCFLDSKESQIVVDTMLNAEQSILPCLSPHRHQVWTGGLITLLAV